MSLEYDEWKKKVRNKEKKIEEGEEVLRFFEKIIKTTFFHEAKDVIREHDKETRNATIELCKKQVLKTAKHTCKGTGKVGLLSPKSNVELNIIADLDKLKRSD